MTACVRECGMASRLTALRAHTVNVARRLETDARDYDKQGGRDGAGPGPVQKMVSDGTVSSVTRDALDRMIRTAGNDVASNSSKAHDVAAVTRELTVYRHAAPQGENAAQKYSTGPVSETSPQQYSSGPQRENSPQRYTEMIEVPPTPEAVAERVAMYAQQAARAQVALGTLIEVREAVVEQLAEQPRLSSAWEALKDSGKAD
jgi:hypothetical protein